MKTIFLIPCCKNKNDKLCMAKDMYKSPMFRMRMRYAEQFDANIYILSAKYGLLAVNQYIEPYNLSLKEFSKDERICWSNKVIEQLKTVSSLEEDKFIILAGNFYMEYILPMIKNYELPLSFCDERCLGKKMQWLKEHTKEKYLLFE